MVGCPGGPDSQQPPSVSTFNSAEFPSEGPPEERLSRRGPARVDGGSGLTKETRDLRANPGAASHNLPPALPVAAAPTVHARLSMLVFRACASVCERVLACNRRGEVRELGGRRTFIRFVPLLNQRDMLMLFFIFSVSQGSEAGLGGEGGQEKEVQSLGPSGSLANYWLFLLILIGRIQTGGVKCTPHPPIPS